MRCVDVATQFAAERRAVAKSAVTHESKVWIWRPLSAIVLTSRDGALLNSAAAHSFAAVGWPVIVRDSGGGPVALGEACLNVSWMQWCAKRPSIEEGYASLCDRLIGALATFGINARCGALEGSYCDGKFNLLVEDRKLAGTSQRIYSTPDGYVRLSHAVLHVLPGINDHIDSLNRFISEAGQTYAFSSDLVTSVAALSSLPRESIFATLKDALMHAFTGDA